MPLPDEARTIVLLGGGRWGGVLLRVLDELLPQGWTISWVSSRNKAEIDARTREIHPSGRVVSYPDIDALDRAPGPRPWAGLIATTPDMHAIGAEKLLRRCIPVLVEKPFALDEREARRLVTLARERNLALWVDLEFRTAPFLLAFRNLAQTAGTVRSAMLEWSDPPLEERYGAIKRADWLTPLCHDVYPHLWSILGIFMPEATLRPLRADLVGGNDGTSVRLALDANETKQVEAILDRWAPARRRILTLTLHTGRTLQLDFTTEPGTVTTDNGALPLDWSNLARPLGTALSSFLAAVGGNQKDFLLDAGSCLDAVTGAVAADELVRSLALETIRQDLAGTQDANLPGRTRAMIAELILPALARRAPQAAREWAETPNDLPPLLAAHLAQGGRLPNQAGVAEMDDWIASLAEILGDQ